MSEDMEFIFTGPPPGADEWGEPQMVVSFQVMGVYSDEGDLNWAVLRIETEHLDDEGREMTIPLAFTPRLAERMKKALARLERQLVIDNKEE